jgi:hypothetical protein
MTDEQGTEAFETMRVLLRDGASADQVRDRLEAADGPESMPLLLGAIFGLKESFDRFITDEEGEREQARKDRAAMRAAFSSLLALAEQQVKLLNEIKTSRSKIVIGRKADEETSEEAKNPPAQSAAPAPAPAHAPAPSPLAQAIASSVSNSLAAQLTEAVVGSFMPPREAATQPPTTPPAPLPPAPVTLADALPEGPALAAFFARELQDTLPEITEAREERPLPPPPQIDEDEDEDETPAYRPPTRRSSIPQMIRPATKPQSSSQDEDGPPPATLAAALARIVEDAAHETEAHAAEHPPLVLTDADIVEEAPPRPAAQSSGAGSNKSAADMSPQEIESLIASTLNQISGMTNR